jgi:hypothetical protein
MAKRYQRAIRSRKSKEGQTTQWPKDTKGKSEAVNQMEGQTIQWPKHNKGKSEAVNQRKDRQYNGQKIPKDNQKP